MNQSLKGPWIAALRSGDYHQGSGQLKVEEYDDHGVESSFCCLGVLCDINGWEFESDAGGVEFGPEELIGNHDIFDRNDGVEVVGESGLTHHDRDQLARMNDGPSSFAEIADWIERNL